MDELLVLAAILTAIAVLVGFGYGIYALRLIPTSANRSSLRLAALNLLEPSATIGTLLAVGVATDAFNSDEISPWLLLAGVPLTVMLLAPLFTRGAASPLHRVIAVYGTLRWVCTVALWAIALTSNRQLLSDDTRILLAVALFTSGLCILIASVLHIGSSLKGERIQSAR